MKRIACYVGTLGSGGIESATVSQYVNMDHNNITFDFIVDEHLSEYEYYTNIIEQNGGRVICLSYGLKSISLINKMFSLFKVLRKGTYDAFHIHASYPSSLIYCAIALLSGVHNRLATSHAQGTTNNGLITQFIQGVCRKFLPLFCTKRIGVSDAAGKWLYGKYGFIVLPNAIDTGKFRYDENIRINVRHDLGIESEVVVGHVGRFAPDKNHRKIIEIFKEYRQLNPEARLLLIGDGLLHTMIEDIVIRDNLENTVVFINHTNEVNKYLQAMDVLLMPSLREACSVVVMEAQASSLPVLASDTIPSENKISDIFFYESLNSSAKEWALKMNEVLNKPLERTHVILKGYYPVDIKELAKTIQKLY